MSQPSPDLGFILVVDDTPTNLSILSQTLKSAGYAVRLAEDGESALDLIQKKHPALILLDVQMPGIDGFETCRRLKAEPTTQAIPIIFTTALADTESKIRGFSLGAVDYIPKPFEQEEVLARVRVHLQLKQFTDHLEQEVTSRTAALHQAQVQLVQQEKLSMLGQLMTGVAHEMNNPIGCIVNNVEPAQEYVAALTRIIQQVQPHVEQLPAEFQEMIRASDLEFILDDLPNLLTSVQLSAERIKEISIALRNFARTDGIKHLTDLHEGLESTLLILQHRLKPLGQRPTIQVIKQYGELPLVECYPGQLNQVVMNLIANAIDAIEEVWQHPTDADYAPVIQISTAVLTPQKVTIRIADNGIGMTADIQQHIFKQLFTTKPAGQGTGLGLAIARQIIVEKHAGRLEVTSTPHQGSEFVITLPIGQQVTN